MTPHRQGSPGSGVALSRTRDEGAERALPGTSSVTVRCEVCANEHTAAFEVVSGGVAHIFDSMECAARALVPRCAHCGGTIFGHGVAGADVSLCSARCAEIAAGIGFGDRG